MARVGVRACEKRGEAECMGTAGVESDKTVGDAVGRVVGDSRVLSGREQWSWHGCTAKTGN